VDTTSKHFRRLSLKDRANWEELPIPRDVQGVALLSDGKYLYRIGGMAAHNEPGKSHDLHSVADFARFDPESKTWTDLAPMPAPRSTHDAVLIGRTIYVSGGWTMSGASEASDFCGDTLAFDLDKPESGWQSIEQPFERRALAVAEQGGKLYVHGGLTGGGMNVERRVDVYDPATKSWSRGPDLPGTGRVDGFGTSAYTIEGTIYHSGASGTIYRLSVGGDAWEPIGAWYLPRITHRILPGPDGTLLAVGGNFRGRQVPEIEAVPVTGAQSSSASTAKAAP
jgi:N-acetylneuraminic acid mutarotase